MNSAAVISRQLRQNQTTGRATGHPVPPIGRARPRTPSQQSLNIPQLLSQHAAIQTGSVTNLASPPGVGFKDKEAKKPKGIETVRTKVSFHCFWNVCKALSGGLFLVMVGTAMSVIGFYADEFSLEKVKQGNRTTEVMNENRKYHLHNLTYVGPVLLGLGGVALVAACVLTFEKYESAGSRVAPVSEAEVIADHSNDGGLVVGLMSRVKLNGRDPAGLYLELPQLSPILARKEPSESSSSKLEDATLTENFTTQLIPNGT